MICKLEMNFLALPVSTFKPSHLCLQEIRATQAKVPCRTVVTLPQCGFLEPSFGKEDLPAGVAFDLPYWAAAPLAKRNYITVTAPKNYRATHREILKADPTVVDLNKMGPYFYQSGLHIASLPIPDTEDLGEILPEILQRRLVSMADLYSYSQALRTAEIDLRFGKLMKECHMDILEHQIYDAAKKGAEEIVAWIGCKD